ncbi:hypothetical protein KC340_g1103 [Hortaea werneckii]|nr:hypothetical protein KC342_g887 [Hortaea werneckii]KAI7107383.1 hypothetical protein KC339_g2427 [Hortaea werneckii]KAI7243321.1 hypothetical protein KC365_g2397 [Hortaea werneckii]KAI7338025.1 hypothetical protein KC340_g1103 [Hortaea werneckii]KAI7375618.1 hypothetical protein KC328_g15331 [Hortaea werneckii]
MADQTPLVLEDVSLTDFMRYVLDHHEGPSTLVVGSTKEDFLAAFRDTAERQVRSDDPQLTRSESPGVSHDHFATHHAASSQDAWTSPTLRMLATSRTVKVVFCPDITHLRAYLAAHAGYPNGNHTSTETDSKRILAFLNPVTLHQPTSAFSAQGLNRTFSGAVEAAYASGSRLIIAECDKYASQHRRNPNTSLETLDPEVRDAAQQLVMSVWDEEVSILNVTTKSFGAGERGWVGRTVRVRDVAGRWCHFEKLPRDLSNGQ